MAQTFISVARSVKDFGVLTPSEKEAVLHDFEKVSFQYHQMLQKENFPFRLKKEKDISYYVSIAQKLERTWNLSQLPTLAQEYEMLKMISKM